MAENNSTENRTPQKPAGKASFPLAIRIAVTVAAALSLGTAMLFASANKGSGISFSSTGSVTTVTASVTREKEAAESKPAKPKKTTTSKTTAKHSTTEAAAVYSFPADINRADLGCLCACPGIGEATAESIIGYRESAGTIHDLNELLSVHGIGEGTLGRIKQYFYVADEDYIPMTATVSTASSETVPSAQATTSPPAETEPPKETETEKTVTPEPSETAPAETTAAAEPQRRPVDINTADAKELADALLIDMELAENIVKLRERIYAFSKPQGLLHAEGMTPALLDELLPYILISPSDKIDDHGVVITSSR